MVKPIIFHWLGDGLDQQLTIAAMGDGSIMVHSSGLHATAPIIPWGVALQPRLFANWKMARR